MKILVVGSGGREHALAWKLAQSEEVESIFVAPGNAGTEQESKVKNIPIHASDLEALAGFAGREKIELTLIGPEAPLVSGITDAFTRAGLRCFGPTQRAAQLEGSKAFAKDFMARHRIPTAAYRSFTDATAAKEFIREWGTPLVIKADGLAAGKGVVIAHSEGEALETVEEMLSGKAFGDAGRRVVLEEFLQGEEASFIVMVDGRHILPLATSQDHKARDNGDRGPNTGGMGAYSPAPVLDPKTYGRIMKEIVEPTVSGMAREGNPYTGFLYAGVMITEEGEPKVLEYNCRFGDPETQPILMRLKSDLARLCMAALDGRLHETDSIWDDRAALGVVMASGGYPDTYGRGFGISGLPERETEGIKVFHSGTRFHGGKIVTDGGRVLCVTALGDSVTEAQRKAYEQVRQIHWDGVYYRTDIGYRAVHRENSISPPG